MKVLAGLRRLRSAENERLEESVDGGVGVWDDDDGAEKRESGMRIGWREPGITKMLSNSPIMVHYHRRAAHEEDVTRYAR